jgi:hypothetical protein
MRSKGQAGATLLRFIPRIQYKALFVTSATHERRTVKRENELRKQDFLSLPQALAFSRMCPLFTMTDDNVKISLFVLFFLHSGGWSPNWVHSARRPLTDLLYLPRVIVRMENLVE